MRWEWNKLLNGITDNTFFLSWERMAPAVKYLGQENKLKILFAIEEEEVLGIAPLRQSSRFFNGHQIYNVIESISDRAPGVLLGKRKAECLTMFLNHLYNQKDWDFLYFNHVPETFSIVNLLKKNSHSIPGFEMKEEDISPYLMIPSSLDKLFCGLTVNFRKNLRNNLSKLEREHGKVELKDYYELGSLDEMMQVFFDIHRKRWISKGEPGAFKTQLTCDMFLYEAKLLSEIKFLRLRFLMVKDRPISVFYGFEYKQVLYYLLGGFDPAFFSYSPSNLLVLKIIERCIHENIKELNFFEGFTSHKLKWCKKFRRNYTFRFVNRKAYSRTIDLGMRIIIKHKLDKLLSPLSFFELLRFREMND